jgi:hypothetical protein
MTSFKLYEGETLGVGRESGAENRHWGMPFCTRQSDFRQIYMGQDITKLGNAAIKKIERNSNYFPRSYYFVKSKDS